MSKQRIKVPQIFIMIFILMRMEPGQAMPINRNLSPVWSAPLLTNLRCNNNTLKYSDTCQTDEGLLQLLLKQCDFKCDEGYTPKCVNTLDVVTAYICLQKDLSCKKGIRWIAQINTEKPSEVIIREEKCPNGTFQSSTSKCFDACSETHQDISLIGEMYSLYSYGDNANPTTVYCNYEKGFYSTEDKMFIDFDRESKFNPFLCRHVDDFNPCYGKMVPLPNGTCVLPCLNGGCRDVHDSFICKERCRQKPGEDVDGTMELSQDNEICNNILDTCKNGECNSKGDCECHKGFTYDEKMRQCKEEKRKEKSPYTVVVQSVSGGVLSVFLIIFFIWSNREKFRRKEDGPESCSLTSSAGTNLSRNEEDHQSLTSTSSGAGNYGEELKKNVDDTLTQSVLASLEKAMESCGALVYKGNMLGTAFRVGEKYLMTAFHVIRDIVEDSREPNHFLLYRIDDTAEAFVTFSESVCVQTHQFRFKVCYYNLANDVAILEITNCSDKLPDPLFLWQFENVWEKISTIGYGHPNNPYKKHLETCTVLRNDDVRFQTAHAYLQRHRLEFIDDIRKQGKKSESINRGYNGYNNEKIVVFDAYMEKGLSGGPILTNQANSIKVIGIVIARMPEFHDHLSDQMKYSFPKVYLFEVGVKMLYIYQSMRSEDPDLAAKLFS